MLADFGVFYLLPGEEKERLTGGAIGRDRFHHPVLGAGISAFGAYYRQDWKTAERTWDVLLANPYARIDLREPSGAQGLVELPGAIPWINTNEASQWSLNTILSLELIADALPNALSEEESVHEA
jgi:hypothetical protein